MAKKSGFNRLKFLGNFRGFTIVEVLIVLAVTSALLIAALASISGRQGRTQFSQAVRETEALVRDVLNDVSNGVLPEMSGFVCTVSVPGAPALSYSALATQADRQDCVLAGKVMQFGTDTDQKVIVEYTAAGRRLNTANQPVVNFSELIPIAIHPDNVSGNDTRINATTSKTIPWGAEIVDSAGGSNALAFGMMYKDLRGGSVSSSEITSGNSGVGIIKVALGAGYALMTQSYVVTQVNSLTSASFLGNAERITICLKSATSNQYGVIYVGGGANGLEVISEVLGDSLSGVTCS